MYLSKYLTIHLFIYVCIYLISYGPDNPPYHIATHAKRILELRAAYRLVLVHITCMFAYVHTHARGTTVIRQRNTHTHSFWRAPNSATPSSQAHTHTPSRLHIHLFLQFIG